jgi:hypothetical protein
LQTICQGARGAPGWKLTIPAPCRRAAGALRCFLRDVGGTAVETFPGMRAAAVESGKAAAAGGTAAQRKALAQTVERIESGKRVERKGLARKVERAWRKALARNVERKTQRFVSEGRATARRTV